LKRDFASLTPQILAVLATFDPVNMGKGIKGMGLPNYYKERGNFSF